MGLTSLRIRNVRNLEAVELQPDAHLNLIFGANASGKTSLLEAIHFLGRARSFRTTRFDRLVRAGTEELSVIGKLRAAGGQIPIGVERTRKSLRIRIGERDVGVVSELVASLPLQLIQPNSHRLLEEGPRYRRQFLDWGVFHVEHGFYPAWQRFQRALRQRNAALRSAAKPALATVWDQELIETTHTIHQARIAYLAKLRPTVSRYLDALLGIEAFDLDYYPGWTMGQDFAELLGRHLQQDCGQGHTGVGPHRADIRFTIGGVGASERVSRGQQKLLVAALLLSQADLFTQLGDRPCLILVDDVAAELDRSHRARIMELLSGLNAQLFLTAIEPESVTDGFTESMKVFHVEHGQIQEVV